MPTALAHHGPNTVRLAKRFFWKECRRLRGLAVGVFLLAMALMGMMWQFITDHNALWTATTLIAVIGGAMLAVAAAVTLYSVEKEEGTAELLERLPRNLSAMAIGKLSAAIVVITLCTIALVAMSFLVSDSTFHFDRLLTHCLPATLLLIVTAFVWSLVASLVCPNPLIAAVLGIAMASVSVHFGVSLSDPSWRVYNGEELEKSAPTGLALAGVGAIVAGWLVTRWPAPPQRRGVFAAELDAPLSRQRLRWPSLRLGLFGRLFWQTLRQSWLTAIVATLLGLFLTFMSIVMVIGLVEIGNGWPNFVIVSSLLFAPALLGAVVFRADQRRDAYRFLAEHAGRPRMLWLARNAAGFAIPAVLLAIMLTVFGSWAAWGISKAMTQSWYQDSAPGVEMLRVSRDFGILRQILIIVAAATVVAYAWGQFFSLALRSDVIAAMLALVASIVIAAWAAIVGVWQLPPLWFLLPLAAGAFVASWLRVRDWMFDRRGVWRWAAPILALAAPFAWLAWATPAWRLAQVAAEPISVRRGDHEFTAFTVVVNKAEEEMRLGTEVAEGYERFHARAVNYELVDVDATEVKEHVPGAKGGEWGGRATKVKVARPVGGRLDGEDLAEFLRLSRVKCRLPPIPGGPMRSNLLAIALMDSPDAEEPIDLDGRLERLLACRRVAIQSTNGSLFQNNTNPTYLADELVAWATAEGQTSTRLIKAIEGLREAEAMLVGPIGHLMNERHQARAVVNGELAPPFLQDTSAPEWLAYMANESLGFERERALKAIDLIASFQAAYLSEPDRSWLQIYFLEDVQLVAAIHRHGVVHNRAQRLLNPYADNFDTLTSARTSYLASMVLDNRQELPAALRSWLAGAAWRRAERVRLALIAYRINHGEYPEELESLVGIVSKGEILDPYSGEPFGWAREGFERRIVFENEFPPQFNDLPAAPGTPLLWCGGSGLAAPREREVRFGARGSYAVPDDDSDVELNGLPLVKVVSLSDVEQVALYPSGKFWMPLPKFAGIK